VMSSCSAACVDGSGSSAIQVRARSIRSVI
jgi:hypothetical protein